MESTTIDRRRTAAQAKELIRGWLARTPASMGLPFPFWTVRRIQRLLDDRAHRMHYSSVYRMMLECGASFYRPERASQRWRARKTAGAVIARGLKVGAWFVDETVVYAVSQTGGGWTIGNTSSIGVRRGAEDKVHVLAGLQFPHLLEWSLLPSPATGAMWAAWVADRLPGPVVADSASIHTALVCQECLTDRDLALLPPHCSHMNPIEDVWAELYSRLSVLRIWDKLTLSREVRAQMEGIVTDRQFLGTLSEAYRLRYREEERDLFSTERSP